MTNNNVENLDLLCGDIKSAITILENVFYSLVEIVKEEDQEDANDHAVSDG